MSFDIRPELQCSLIAFKVFFFFFFFFFLTTLISDSLELSSGAVHALEGHSDMIDSVVVINGQLMSCCFDGTIRCWSLDDGRCQTTLRKPSPPKRQGN